MFEFLKLQDNVWNFIKLQNSTGHIYSDIIFKQILLNNYTKHTTWWCKEEFNKTGWMQNKISWKQSALDFDIHWLHYNFLLFFSNINFVYIELINNK